MTIPPRRQSARLSHHAKPPLPPDHPSSTTTNTTTTRPASRKPTISSTPPKPITKAARKPTADVRPPTVALTSSTPSDTEPILLPNPTAFHDWLLANHLTTPSITLILARTTRNPTQSPPPPPPPPTTLTRHAAVDEALCFGWIDGVVHARDESTFLVRFTPRRKGSSWSKRNVARIAVLRAEGRVKESGEEAWRRWEEAERRRESTKYK